MTPFFKPKCIPDNLALQVDTSAVFSARSDSSVSQFFRDCLTLRCYQAIQPVDCRANRDKGVGLKPLSNLTAFKAGYCGHPKYVNLVNRRYALAGQSRNYFVDKAHATLVMS